MFEDYLREDLEEEDYFIACEVCCPLKTQGKNNNVY